ncbi:MAG: L-lactate dehydrogenase [Clostridia bacterium]|nr:L-lactate dehydrogenase [Clostridia bacterium]
MKVTIIGAGAVGATTAYAILAANAASEIVLIDVNKDKASGEALDMVQATPLLFNSKVRAGEYADAVDSDVVVISSGVGRKPGQTRLELAQINVNILKAVSSEIVKYAPKAFYLLVANPVDVLTYAFIKFTGLPKTQVVGTGTLLDTIRLRTMLSECYKVNQSQVYANVLGEHGDSSFVSWSTATIGGVPLNEYVEDITAKNVDFKSYTHEEAEEYVKKSGGTIIAKKGCTVYGIATSVMYILKCLQGESETVLPLSTLMEGEYGIKDVCLSTLALIGKNGLKSTVAQKLSDEEVKKMQASAEALKTVISSINF